MTIQVTVRLPDDEVAFMDGLVEGGGARSRADVVSRALRRERRRLAAERDAAIYAAVAEDELDAVAGAVSATPLDLD